MNNSNNKRFNRGNSVAVFGGTRNIRGSSMSARNSELKKTFNGSSNQDDTTATMSSIQP